MKKYVIAVLLLSGSMISHVHAVDAGGLVKKVQNNPKTTAAAGAAIALGLVSPKLVGPALATVYCGRYAVDSYERAKAPGLKNKVLFGAAVAMAAWAGYATVSQTKHELVEIVVVPFLKGAAEGFAKGGTS